MKKNFSYYNGIWVALLVLFVSCTEKEHHHEHQDTTSVKNHVLYHCPMHPEVISDKPGICPKCNMDLELIPAKTNADTLAFILQPSNHNVVSNIKTIVPSSSKESSRIEAEGYLTYDPDQTVSIATKVSGRIEQVYVHYNFQRVQKGQKLLELYSPELLTVQNEYLLLLRSKDSSDVYLRKVVKEKLLLLGMTESGIQQIAQTNKANARIPLYATSDGHVHFLSEDTNMETHALSWISPEQTSMNSILRAGTYVSKGDKVITISKDTNIWALLKIKASNVSRIQTGNPVELYIDGNLHEGRIDFIEKSFKPGTDFYTIRVYLSGEHHNRLTIGTLVHGYIAVQANQKPQVWIPSSALIYLGRSEGVVFIKSSPGYVATKIQVGEISSEWTEVLSGLTLTDSIASVASYLVDSEAFIQTDN